MANQQKPKQDPRSTGQGQQAGNQPGREQQPGRPANPGRDSSQPGGTPGSKPDPYKHPGDEEDVQPDVIAGEPRRQQGGPGASNPSATDKPRYGNTGGDRSGGKAHGK